MQTHLEGMPYEEAVEKKRSPRLRKKASAS